MLDYVHDWELVEALLSTPPRREALPPRRPGPPPAAVNPKEQRALYRALSCTHHSLIRELLVSALTEPMSHRSGPDTPVEPFAMAPSAGRMARWLLDQGHTVATVRQRLQGLRRFWEALGHSEPDTWVAFDVAEVLCDWHRDGQGVAAIYDGVLAARALWASDLSESGHRKLGYFADFLQGLAEVF